MRNSNIFFRAFSLLLPPLLFHAQQIDGGNGHASILELSSKIISATLGFEKATTELKKVDKLPFSKQNVI